MATAATSASFRTADLKQLASQLPHIWVGYALTIIQLVMAAFVGDLDPNGNAYAQKGEIFFTVLVGMVAIFYWLYCVYRIHAVLGRVPGWRHPISPGASIGYEFVPFYNLYWTLKWPDALLKFARWRLGYEVGFMHLPGIFLLLGFVVERFVDASLGLFVIFITLSYLKRMVRKSLSSEGVIVPPDQLSLQSS